LGFGVLALGVFPNGARGDIMKKFLISCGGTGGHLSPGIALAEGLAARGHDATLLISEKKVDARLSEKYPHLRFERVPGRGFSWQPAQAVRCVISQTKGFLFCRRRVRSLRPDGIVSFGGFTAAGVVLAGRMQGVPVVLHESNHVPGRATRTLSRFARRIYLPLGVQLAGVRAGVVRHAGQPVRREFVRHPAAAARSALGLVGGQKVLVVLGGSQGATPLNEWTRANLSSLAAEGIQVYCVTGLGKGESGPVELKTKTGAPVRTVFEPFSDRIAELLSAADLVVSRAGAGTIAELIRCETPAILVPFPQAADDHQRANAEFFERQGGGKTVAQANLGTLLREVLALIFDDAQLEKFRKNLRRLGEANALEMMLDDLEEIAISRAAPPRSAQPSAA
jgi:UDP-N-acetylglucosamine--N-acetylmuramyl-(pentapeptide) pyrophosphoryl-undecaprenol N-acetylglucosamine transferase